MEKLGAATWSFRFGLMFGFEAAAVPPTLFTHLRATTAVLTTLN